MRWRMVRKNGLRGRKPKDSKAFEYGERSDRAACSDNCGPELCLGCSYQLTEQVREIASFFRFTRQERKTALV